MIELTGVSRTWEVGGRPVHALRDVTLSIGAGEYVSVMGPSGSGKSTLLSLLGGLDRPTAGSYRFEGREVASLPDEELSRLRRERIGFVFQSFHLVPRMTALENVALPLLLAGVAPKERTARAAEALASVGLSPRLDHRPDQLSGGEKQRVCLARAVVTRPGLVLADEPTGNLDSASGAEIVALLERLHSSGITLLVVTHDAGIGGRARRRVRLADGSVVGDEAA
ncbi:MAG TPA: ABC transporter ATP-binding protein [Thermoanaerobaculia bacterium]|nr:ABC transporter ATP-binding protein [Thermoanaerobaculia bacterium]HQN08027.1 ABC transporter ATP-binding protein [Thermoanaerobaculia bacterium]HQP87176.1 ABC transporter ATP-binding protein [Thermoanaerobaculia bacterium]